MNYFDVYSDTIINYDEYTANGNMHWDDYKFNEKSSKIDSIEKYISSYKKTIAKKNIDIIVI